jgi:hypothetical protein
MATSEAPSETAAQSPKVELANAGYTTIRGLRLSRDEFERISIVNVLAELESFGGRSLLVGISPSGSVPPALHRLRDHLDSLGGEVTLEVIEHSLPTPFGDYYYRNVGLVRIDTRLELDQAIAGMMTAWALKDTPAAVATEAS